MKIRVLFLLLAASFLLGCGKGVPNAPSVTANAGEDQTVFINLQCELDGSASTGTPESFSWSVKTLPSGVSSLTIVSSGEKKAFFTPSASGAYEFTLSVQKGEDFSEDTVKYTVVPFSKASIDSGFYGVCAHLSSHDGSTEADLDAHINSPQDIGAQFVRFDFDWEDIEPSNDRFDFSKYDSIAAKLKAKNIKILGVLDYGNLWCDPTTGETSAINKFADFAYNAAKHFKLNIKLWEIWNEPNNPFFWTTTSAEAYTRLLKASYGAVKQADPPRRLFWEGCSAMVKIRFI